MRRMWGAIERSNSVDLAKLGALRIIVTEAISTGNPVGHSTLVSALQRQGFPKALLDPSMERVNTWAWGSTSKETIPNPYRATEQTIEEAIAQLRADGCIEIQAAQVITNKPTRRYLITEKGEELFEKLTRVSLSDLQAGASLDSSVHSSEAPWAEHLPMARKYAESMFLSERPKDRGR